MLCDIDTLRTEHNDFRERLGQLEGQLGVLHKGGFPDYYSMLDIIGHMAPGKDGSHHYNEALLFQQLRRRTGRPWLVVEVLKRRRQMVEIQRAYVAGLRDQIALEEGAVFPVAFALLLDEDWLAVDSAAANRGVSPVSAH